MRVRKVVDRSKRVGVLGDLKKELAGRSVKDLLDELRSPVKLPKARRTGTKADRRRRRFRPLFRGRSMRLRRSC